MTERVVFRPPFDEEFPNSERKLPDNIEHAIEQGTMTPRMVGYDSGYTDERVVPLSQGYVDETTEAAQRLAKISGRRPDDHDWRYN